MGKNHEYESPDFSELIEIQEGVAKIFSFPPKDYSDTGKALTKSMPVFYNPVQELNRSLSMVVYKTFLKKYRAEKKLRASKKSKNEDDATFKEKSLRKISFVDTMAASGVRSVRLQKYLENPIKIVLNDLNPTAIALIKQNLKANEIKEQ